MALLATLVHAHGKMHSDEPMCADTAINVLHGRGFINNASDWIPPDTPAPLAMMAHTAGLSAWMSAFGSTRTAVIGFNVALFAASATLLRALFLRLVPKAPTTLTLLLPALFFCHPASNAVYSINRYDAIGTPLFLTAALILFWDNSFSRRLTLALLGFATPFVGLHVALAAVAMSLVMAALFATSEDVRLREAAVDALYFGLSALVSTLILLYAIPGDGPRDSRASLTARLKSAQPLMTMLWQATIGGAFASPIRTGVFPLAFTLAVLALKDPGSLPSSFRVDVSPAMLGIILNFTVALALGVLGAYYYRYNWLVAPPLLISLMACLSRRDLSPLVSRAALATGIISAVPGLPASAFAAAIEWQPWNYGSVSSFINDHVSPEDRVYSDFGGYYGVKSVAQVAYFGPAFNQLPDSKKSSLRVAVFQYPKSNDLSPNEERVLAEIGGEWKLSGELHIPRGTLRQKIPPAPRVPTTWHFKIFCRVDEAINDSSDTFHNETRALSLSPPSRL